MSYPSSLKNMQKMKDRWLGTLPLTAKVLDVGGRGLNADRSYKRIFPQDFYCIADINPGYGVTHVMPSPYTLPFEDEEFDVVVSGQMLEHCSNPFKSVQEMVRVLKTGGVIILIAPSEGPTHDQQDGWRFKEDAFRFIAEDIGSLSTLQDYIDTSATDKRSARWRDHVFVAKKV